MSEVLQYRLVVFFPFGMDDEFDRPFGEMCGEKSELGEPVQTDDIISGIEMRLGKHDTCPFREKMEDLAREGSVQSW